ncbi:sensor histidine kinase [Pedobacter sp. Hv1]|uniref:sensor histidine kinase n=1 Tax=Pedobacter sp. Hv1 TaxID=1740090 RepID=UPI0006E4EAD1|nr:histidine kinase [Pedobacter sp. Hv1]KQC01059.1 hypothetical protein AQF98_10355 [Pedobacter sp. Hv1]
MDLFNLKKISTKQLQWLVWLSVFLISFSSMVTVDGIAWSFTFNIITTGFYALIVYGNISWLFPRYYERNQKLTYVILVLLFLTLCGFAKGHLIGYVYNTFFNDKAPQHIEWYRMVYLSINGVIIFMLSFMLRIVLAYFTLKQQTEEILLQKTRAELNLLKSQVQPHFLFNTLNNIYYEAYMEAPKTAGLIERLAMMMRYFLDESPKTVVAISTELNFLENYIELEKIRIRHQIVVNFTKDYQEDYLIPPMLMMTLVENIFKHGIDKLSNENIIKISLVQEGNYLVFKTLNSYFNTPDDQTGLGIENLRKRLIILYGDRFELRTGPVADFYMAHFKIPIS